MEVTRENETARIARQLAERTEHVREMAEQLQMLRERVSDQQERADSQQERIDVAARELHEVIVRLQAARDALSESAVIARD